MAGGLDRYRRDGAESTYSDVAAMIERMNARHGRVLPANSLSPTPNRISPLTQPATRPGRKVIPFILEVEVPETTSDRAIGDMLMNILRNYTPPTIRGHFRLSVGERVSTVEGNVVQGTVVHTITDME